ncbi:MAG: DUF202 domain-containing protein [Anaerohalosphaeraceae bacterium]
MGNEPYERFAQRELILRDELAIDRTLLANERTLLAYLRSAVALLIAGLTIIHFVGSGWFLAMGVLCIPGAVVVTVIGLRRYHRMDRRIRLVRRKLKDTAESGRAAD